MGFFNWITDNVNVVALFVAFLSIIFTCIFSFLQQRHNKKSIRPIGVIVFFDYENCISVQICNYGIGPLIVKDLIITDGMDVSDKVLDFMPSINQHWDNFIENIEGRTIPVNGNIELIKITPKTYDTKVQVRQALSQLTIKLIYMDVYDKKFKVSRECSFFGRTLSKYD